MEKRMDFLGFIFAVFAIFFCAGPLANSMASGAGSIASRRAEEEANKLRKLRMSAIEEHERSKRNEVE